MEIEDDPFMDNTTLFFLNGTDGLVYLEQANMLQVEDVEDFSQPVFVEIKPLHIQEFPGGTTEARLTCPEMAQELDSNKEFTYTLEELTLAVKPLSPEAPGRDEYILTYPTTEPLQTDEDILGYVQPDLDLSVPMQDDQLPLAPNGSELCAHDSTKLLDTPTEMIVDPQPPGAHLLVPVADSHQDEGPAQVLSCNYEDVEDVESHCASVNQAQTPVVSLQVKIECMEDGISSEPLDSRAYLYTPESEPHPVATIDLRETTIDGARGCTGHLDDVAAAPSAARRRYILDAVEVPTLSLAMKKRYTKLGFVRDAKDIIAKSEKKFNQKVSSFSTMQTSLISVQPKVKKEIRKLDADSVRARMKTIGLGMLPIPLDKSIVDTTLSRDMMSHHEKGTTVKKAVPSQARKRKPKAEELDFDDDELLLRSGRQTRYGHNIRPAPR
ncbi:hypothetical protein DXG01_012624 [Tephrocybe rancida]|nr:hypothetical protein DXG01_012624 [Tephrocybe rancida]